MLTKIAIIALLSVSSVFAERGMMTWTNPSVTTFGIDIFNSGMDDESKDFYERPEIKFVYGPQTTVGELKNNIYTYFADREAKSTKEKPGKTLVNKNYTITIKKNGKMLSDDFIMPDVDMLKPHEQKSFALMLKKKPQEERYDTKEYGMAVEKDTKWRNAMGLPPLEKN